MRLRHAIVVGLWIAGAYAPSVWAQPVEFQPEDTGTGLERLDSQDVVLMASRRVQTIQEAPMIVTVITREQIRHGGFRTMEEILRTIPGFEQTVYQGGRQGQVLARGQSRSLLFLLNGVPYYTFVYNTPYDLERTFDVQMIEKIEVVSGPGGVLWGASALLGIVNVITRDAGEGSAEQEFSIGGGDGPGERQVLRGFARTGGRLGDFRYSVMASYLQTQGPELKLDDSPFQNPGPFVWDQDLTFFGNSGTTVTHTTSRFVSGMATLSLGDFSLFGYVPFSQRALQVSNPGSLISSDRTVDDMESVIERFEPSVYLRFKRRWMNDKIGIQATGSLQAHNFDQVADPERCVEDETYCGFVINAAEPTNPSVPPGGLAFSNEDRTRRLGLSVEFDATLPYRNQLVWGLDLYQDWGLERFKDFRPTPVEDYSLAVPPSERLVFTSFIRDEWRIVEPVALGAGVRYVGSDSLDPFVVSEVAAVWNITGRLYARGSFAEGFRAPSVEACCSLQGPSSFGGNPELLPETSRSVEGELNLVTLEDVGPISKLYMRADYSYSQLRNIIESIAGQYFNRGSQNVHSVEFLSRLELDNRSSFWLAYYYVSAVDERYGPIRYNANHILNAAFSIRLLRWLNLTSNLTAVGPREDPNRISDLPNDQASMSSVIVDRLDPYFLWRAGLLVHDVPVNVLRDFELRIFGDNLLDQHYYASDTGSDDKTNPISVLRPGWSVFADISYRIGGAR